MALKPSHAPLEPILALAAAGAKVPQQVGAEVLVEVVGHHRTHPIDHLTQVEVFFYQYLFVRGLNQRQLKGQSLVLLGQCYAEAEDLHISQFALEESIEQAHHQLVRVHPVLHLVVDLVNASDKVLDVTF